MQSQIRHPRLRAPALLRVRQPLWVATREKSLTAEHFTAIFLDSYFKLHGPPDAVVSDRDPRFTGGFWQHPTTLQGTRTKMPTAFRLQTDEQAEKANSIAERYLRTFAAANDVIGINS